MELQKHIYQLDNVIGKLEIEYLPFVNYVLNINNVPVIEKINLSNDSDKDWHNVEFSLTGDLLLDSVAKIDTIATGKTLNMVKEVEIVVNPLKLVELTEADGTFFNIRLSVDGKEVLNKNFSLIIQAYDQWIGSIIRPDLLAAFVTPNHPLISKIIGNARPVLKRLTGSDSFDAYQSGDANRVRCQVAAIYEVLRGEGISYITSPASFEVTGQRIRLVDKVLDEKMGTCIDLSLLYASCLEAIGLNPLIVLTNDHCFVGCWLVKDSYSQSVGDDPDFLLKGISDGISEIVVLEATCLTSTDAVSFEEACAKGCCHLNVESEFEYFIDVFQTRMNHVRPIPLRVRQNDGSWQIINDASEHEASAGKVKVLDRYDLSSYDAESAEVTKYIIWERKLLDFSLRNTLLNIRSGRRVIPLLSFAIDRLEDFLSDGKSFNIRPFPLENVPTPGERGIYLSSEYASVEEHVLDQMKQRRLFSFLTEEALANSLKYVYRASRTSMEENGANNLYLVLGLLKWYESEQSKDAHFAPLLLLPIEVVRTLRGGGYTIRIRDDEVSLNITLVELLRQQHDIDLSILNVLPKDDHGVDVKKILAIVRDKIRNKKGWNVLDESLIGIFSFNKFVMWNDIHTNLPLLHKNDIISSLVDGQLHIDATELAPVDVRQIDQQSKPSDYAIPIDVDSSQLEAIIASGEGKSFILHGPPGTGKSQTITNIIANALYQGKRVLFVAEKMAALEVVQDRLSKIGLAPFCLELHSNKATKQHFLLQMEEALNVARDFEGPDYEAQSEKVFEKRSEILKYVEALHKKDSSGLSLYDCIEHYFAVKDCDDSISFDGEKLAVFTPAMLEEAIEKIRNIRPVLKLVGNLNSHPLSRLNVCYDFEEAEKQLRLHLPETAKWFSIFDNLFTRFVEIWYFPAPNFDCSDNELSLFNELLKAPELSGNLVRLILSVSDIDRLLEILTKGMHAIQKRDNLAAKYSKQYLDLDTTAIQSQWREVNAKWFLPRYFAGKKFMGMLPPCAEPLSFDKVPALLDEIDIVNESLAEFMPHEAEFAKIFGESTFSGNKWQRMQSSLRIVKDLANLKQELYRKHTVILRDENIEKIASAVDKMDKSEILKAIYLNNEIIEANSKIKLHFGKYRDFLSSYDSNLSQYTQRWAANISLLKDWIIFRKHLVDLSKFVDHDCWRELSHKDSINHTIKALQKGFYEAKARKIIEDDVTLNYFSGIIFDDTIVRYRELTKQLQQLSKQAVFHRLASNLPSMQMVALDTSELGILKRNIKNGGRGKSIRSIIDLVPTLLPKLCPCMLMSPISVAQYISLESPQFDLVIFDEASQMPTSEALGAIARGKSVIVVGDPKQMPPTSFFSNSSVGEDEAHIDDMESILDDCIAMSIPSKYLTWHYRSKHESLITFSNKQYYGSSLTTFPSVDNMTSKVTLRQIDGVYDRSRSRCNQIEAKAVVAEVIRRLSDDRLAGMSIGIVAFSKVQQNKIEDLLNAELAKYPELEEMAFNSREPIFVKNLENVQGDERDVILFSVGYGPDKTGKVSMNFGPLNISGGERRLNVAVSRARYEMIVFSSLRPEQIDLRRTNALGVAGLKHFLEYAASGKISDLQPTQSLSDRNHDNVAFQLQEIVREVGCEYDINVGSSDFKIDIAIKDPGQPSKYILGILLDGPAYYRTKTTRDREIVQPTVLGLLKWNILKVWTLDIMNRPDAVKEMIELKLSESLETKHHQNEPATITADKKDVNYKETLKIAIVEAPAPPVNKQCLDYPEVSIPMVEWLDNADQLKDYFPELCSLLRDLINIESPITNNLLYKRVVKAFGLSRVSSKVQLAVNSALKSISVYSQPNGDDGTVYWAAESASEAYDKYRVNSNRDFSDIPLIEIENAMLFVLRQQIALEADDLKRLTANQFGYTRKGANIEAITAKVLSNLVEKKIITKTDTKVSLT